MICLIVSQWIIPENSLRLAPVSNWLMSWLIINLPMKQAVFGCIDHPVTSLRFSTFPSTKMEPRHSTHQLFTSRKAEATHTDAWSDSRCHHCSPSWLQKTRNKKSPNTLPESALGGWTGALRGGQGWRDVKVRGARYSSSSVLNPPITWVVCNDSRSTHVAKHVTCRSGLCCLLRLSRSQ